MVRTDLGDIKFKPPERVEVVLLVLMVFTLFLADVNQNKFNDFGLDYKVTFYQDLGALGTFQMKAITLFWVAIIIFHILLVSVFTLSILKRGTFYGFDLIAGIVALLGLVILVSGALLTIYTAKVPVFWGTIAVVTYYHVGILLEVLAGLWFASTE
tara:strand:+ start:1248 stop:1715 length:468 start_codon:yes stop_codon:yes gene_type:complete